MTAKNTSKSTGQPASSSGSAGARHGSNARQAERDQSPNGLQERTGEFRIGENIIFGTSNGNIKIRRSPQGDEVEVGEATLAGLMIDAFFTDKFEGEYETVTAPKKTNS